MDVGKRLSDRVRSEKDPPDEYYCRRITVLDDGRKLLEFFEEGQTLENQKQSVPQTPDDESKTRPVPEAAEEENQNEIENVRGVLIRSPPRGI